MHEMQIPVATDEIGLAAEFAQIARWRRERHSKPARAIDHIEPQIVQAEHKSRHCALAP
jgi:hypothetical protein